ncbi:MAG: class I SAM-dependent methyltransferase [Methanoregula sp.]|jgi:SAM-dependent methyltransferase|nr:class I SAM-dependent methyltransferase [Methanoregula sp.]
MQTEEIDAIYKKVPLERIPWNIESPPDVLIDLVKSGRIRQCRAIDFGCGAGNYAVWLARLGFDVTGVDSSPTAIQIARDNAEKKGVQCTFVIADLLGDPHPVEGTFDFAYDYELLHHLLPEERAVYIKNVYRLTRPRATYLSVCFSDEDPHFGGRGKSRKTPLGTLLYFSSEDEIRDLVSPHFHILELKTMEVAAKFGGTHKAIYILCERK